LNENKIKTESHKTDKKPNTCGISPSFLQMKTLTKNASPKGETAKKRKMEKVNRKSAVKINELSGFLPRQMGRGKFSTQFFCYLPNLFRL
jgi:hypothetical protein